MPPPDAPALVALTDPALPLPRPWLQAPGGFLWWYTDLVDARGNGLVVIWSYGLPFLPGYAAAARAGRPQAPTSRPSLNVAVYEEGRLACYLLHELRPGEATYEEGPATASWRFGDSRIERQSEGGRLTLRLHLDCPLPGSDDPLRGEVLVEGAPCRLEGLAPVDLEDGANHLWSPVTGLAMGHYDLRVGAARFTGRDARAYHDRNAGRAPLHALGIDTWLWGRASLPDEELVYYVLWSHGRETGAAPDHCLGFSLARGGALRQLELQACAGPRRLARYGMPLWPRLRLTAREAGRSRVVHITRRHRVDDGPFYLRHLTEVRVDGATAVPGVEELIAPARVDLAPLRPLVRMRVTRAGEAASPWAPLFLGPAQGRLGRLWRSLTPGRRPAQRRP